MPEISVKDQIKKLIEIQKIDGEVYHLKEQLILKPKEVEALKELFESKKTKLHELEGNLKNLSLDRKAKELDLKTREEQIAKSNAQLSALKTNKEYSAKISEIENIKADKSLLEEKILLSMDDSDALTEDINKEKGNVAEEEKKYLSAKKQVEEDVKVIEDRIKVLEGQRNQLIPEIDPNYLNKYEKILNNKQGIAIVPILSGASCGGCFINLNPQMINSLRMQEEMICCEMCTRILYLEEEN